MPFATALPIALLLSLSTPGSLDGEGLEPTIASPATSTPTTLALPSAPAPALALSHLPRDSGDHRAQTRTTYHDEEARRKLMERTFLHGFRLGGMYINNHESVALPGDRQLAGPFMFLMGYEFFYRVEGGEWLNVLLVANGMIGGLEQSLFIPSANFLIGFEFNNQFQVGVGPNLKPPTGVEGVDEKIAHVTLAMGWTPLVGAFYVPVHFFIVPDVDNEHRFGMTVGATW